MKFALVLFDIDGCTAVVNSEKVTPPPRKATRGKLKVGKEEFLVETLEISDCRQSLDSFEDRWSTSHRAKAVDAEISLRLNPNGKRRKAGGFLNIWPTDMDEDTSIQDERKKDDAASFEDISLTTDNQPSEIRPKIKEGTNGRKISVLLEGQRNRDLVLVVPKRKPCFTEHLLEDEAELISNQVENFRNNKVSRLTNTDEVIIIQNEDELKKCYPKPKTCDVAVQCDAKSEKSEAPKVNPKNVESHSVQTSCDWSTDCTCEAKIKSMDSKINNIFEFETKIKSLESKIDNVLSILTTKTSFPSSDFLPLIEIPTSCTQNPEEHSSSSLPAVEFFEETHVKTMSTSTEIPSTFTFNTIFTPHTTTPLPPLVEDIDTFATSSPSSCSRTLPLTTSATSLEQLPSSIPTTALPETTNASQAANITSCDSSVHKTPTTTTALSCRRSPSAIKLQCFDGPIQEIESSLDVMSQNVEYRLKQQLVSSIKSNSSSDGIFAWTLTKTLFSKNELCGRNFHGRKGKPGLSPRRRHAIEHAVIDNLGETRYSVAVNSINTGIRNLNRVVNRIADN